MYVDSHWSTLVIQFRPFVSNLLVLSVAVLPAIRSIDTVLQSLIESLRDQLVSNTPLHKEHLQLVQYNSGQCNFFAVSRFYLAITIEQFIIAQMDKRSLGRGFWL